MPSVTKSLTVGAALSAVRGRVPGYEAHALLGALLQTDRAALLAHPERPLTPEQADRFAALVGRLAAGEPLPYLVGRQAFYDRDFFVTPDVLIPRPETELLIEEALAFARRQPDLTMVDVGTGSGALAVTLAARLPAARVIATDISPAALEVARRNAEQHAARVDLLPGDLLQPLIERQIKVNLLLANLPYIASGDLPALAVSRHEPRLALDGGADGLDLIRRLLVQAPAVCHPGARLLLEIGADQGAAALALVLAAFPAASARLLRDLAGHDRAICADLA
ncbi:MAG: peptide chain release factor N(5)-glutamine methyltransferase [Chloroflexi bacterium]|nr:peptide chain release factor N(5)-glutamine methyltransferase [Chloroflexota bacterium]